MRHLFLLAALVTASSFSLSASAVERIEEPYTFRHGVDWKLSSQLELAPVDMKRVAAEDLRTEREGGLKRIGIARKETATENYERDGEWSVVGDTSIWRLKVSSADAVWLSFSFENLFLPSGASLFVYGENKEQLFGPYTEKDNNAMKTLWTPMVDGQTAYVEINVPQKMKPYLSFDLRSVNHGYREIKEGGGGGSGACNIDVVCPQGNPWREEIRSVAHYVFERDIGFFICTGNMVNTVVGDRKPYFLTAAHCVSTPDEARSMVLFWNYETSTCGGMPDGSRGMVQSGATLLATLNGLAGSEPTRDMTLVRLDSTPDDSLNVYRSGWDSTFATPTSGVSIHHPAGFEKRISVESDPVRVANFTTNQFDVNGVHLVVFWEEGTTEGGSSGAGFWNQQKRLVGVLSGGDASCANPGAPDFYSFLAPNYDVGSSSTENLKSWLDPNNTGVSGVDGVESCNAPNASFSISPNVAEINQEVRFTPDLLGGSGLTYAWDFNGDGLTDSTQASPAFVYTDLYIGNVTLTVSNSEPCSGTDSAAMIVEPEGGNNPPVASAVANPGSSADEETTVELDATASIDPNNDTLSYSWTQTGGPTVTLNNATNATATFIAPQVSATETLSFEVTVSDPDGLSDAASVTVSVRDVPAPVVTTPPASSGGGGAVGWPLLFLLATFSLVRVRRSLLSRFAVLGICSLAMACATVDPVAGSTTTDGVEAQTSKQTANKEMPVLVLRKLKDKSSVIDFADSNVAVNALAAFENRVRRYEKIKPLFEYAMDINVDGVNEVWMISPSGYIQQEKSYELYKMDVSALKGYMQ